MTGLSVDNWASYCRSHPSTHIKLDTSLMALCLARLYCDGRWFGPTCSTLTSVWPGCMEAASGVERRCLYPRSRPKKGKKSLSCGTTPSHWFGYMDEAWVKMKVQEYMNIVHQVHQENRYLFLDCTVLAEMSFTTLKFTRSLPRHTHQY